MVVSSRRSTLFRAALVIARKHKTKLLLSLVAALLLFGLYPMIFLTWEAEGWSRGDDRNVSHYILPGANTTLLWPRALAPFLGERGRRLRVLLLVSSSPEKARAREVIRRTWQRHLAEERAKAEGAAMTGECLVLFVLGHLGGGHQTEQVQRESAAHGDVLAEDFVDTYPNLTLKSMMMLKFLHDHTERRGLRLDYAFKVDDDVFVNLPQLLTLGIPQAEEKAQALRRRRRTEGNNSASSIASAPDGGLLVGQLAENAPPIRFAGIFGTYKKWVVPRWMYPKREFPTYLGGPGYLVSGSSVDCLYHAALREPLLNMEDVFVTGVLAERCRVPRLPGDGWAILNRPHCLLGREDTTVLHYKSHEAVRADIYSMLLDESPPPDLRESLRRLRALHCSAADDLYTMSHS